MLMGVAGETVTEIARDLCAFFHQESVMVTEAESSIMFIRESLSNTKKIE